MKSYLYQGGKWLPCKANKKIIKFDRKKIKNTVFFNLLRRLKRKVYDFTDDTCKNHHIVDIARIAIKIESPDDLNLVIKKSKLCDSSELKAISWIKNFQLCPFITNENYPENHSIANAQLYVNEKSDNNTLLICFCGIGKELNIPITVFHAKYSQYFGAIAYFFRSDYYDYPKLLKKVHEIYTTLPCIKRTALIGTSAGAHMPIILSKEATVCTNLSFSPMLYNEIKNILPYYLDSSCNQNTQIYYSKEHPADLKFAEYCKSFMATETFSKIFIDVSHISSSHMTLQTLFQNNMLDGTMKKI